MWTCSTCGEAHEDRFKDCWKCAGDELAQDAAPEAPTPREERKLRSLASVLSRAGIALFVGAVIGMAIASRTDASEPAVIARAGGVVGLMFAGVVGLVLWVFYPYEPTAVRNGSNAPVDQAEGGQP